MSAENEDNYELAEDEYMVDCILAEKVEDGVTKYLIKWYVSLPIS